MIVQRIWHQPGTDDVTECVSLEITGGPKRYLRLFAGALAPEWGWQLHPTAELVWTNPTITPDPET